MTSTPALGVPAQAYSTVGIGAFTWSLIGGAVLYLPRLLLMRQRTLGVDVLFGQPSTAQINDQGQAAGGSTIAWLATKFPSLGSAADAVLGGNNALSALFNTATSSASTAGLSSLLAIFFGLWVVSVYMGDVSIVDSLWSLGFLLLTLVYREHPDTLSGYVGRKQLVLVTVGLWALRLSGYISWRNHGQGEDYRYKAMRKRMGSKFTWVSLFTVFGFQALLCWIISQPLLAAQMGGPQHLTPHDFIGALVWLVGFLFEAVGDLQLARFKSNPQNKGKLLTTGLWRYTRHPNYFGNAAMFWGFWMMAASTQGGWKTIYSPALMTFLLLKVSGVALLERGLKKTKPGYEKYIASTSSFFPWLPSNKN